MTSLTESDNQFHEELCAEDELGSVIRAHLHIEQRLNLLLETLVPFYTELKPLNLDFESRVHLALAMGLKKDYKAPLLNLGNIRNKYAHKKGYKLSVSDSNNFYKTFAKEEKEIIQNGYKTIPSKNTIWAKLTARDKFILCSIVLDNVLLSALNDCNVHV